VWHCVPNREPEQVNIKRDTRFKKYSSYNTLIIEYTKRKPISVILLDSGVWVVALKENSSIELQFDRYEGIVNGMHYWSITIETIENMMMHDLNTKCISHYCILLPKLTNDGLPKSTHPATYCLIESQWMDAVPNCNGTQCFVDPIINIS
jgi:hypothetical protein